MLLRSLFVAQMMRTSTVTSLSPPTRLKDWPCSTLSNFACTSGGSSPTSSRKSVPPSACSKRPAWRSRAPVNAPRSKPKSSLSMRDPGSTAQLTLTKGALRLADICWIVVATTSLPQPDSPVTITVAS